MQIIT